MIYNWYSYYTHTSIWKRKRAARAHQLASVPPEFRAPPDGDDTEIVSTPISQIVTHAQSGLWSPSRILRAFGRHALAAHRATNCLSEILLSSSVPPSAPTPTTLPLYGLPVSLKDSIDVAGYDSTNGYSVAAFRPARADSALVRLLKDAGAQVYVKTNVPTTLLSFDTRNDLHGATTNPHSSIPSPHPPLAPGGSSGGEAALIAGGGGRIGIGTDIAGSVRVPAHFCGIYSVRGACGRFPRAGIQGSLPGQEGVLGIASPMARTLDDLEWFWRRVVECEPWKYDTSCNVIPWRPVDYLGEGRKLKFGVMWDDGLVRPTPACRRALSETVDRLRKAGHEVVDFVVPDAPQALIVGWTLLLADGGVTITSRLHAGEFVEPGLLSLLKALHLPSLIKRLYVAYLRWRGDGWYADLVQSLSTKSVAELWQLVAWRNGWRQRVQDALDGAALDFVLCAPNPSPAPVGGPNTGKALLLACGDTFLWNILDYSAGVLPVSAVDPALDAATLEPKNVVERRLYNVYDTKAMSGAPVGVQVVGRRLEEEKVLAAMRVIQDVWK
ncbi:amidase signature enzyme [Auricularia subglabra TFB-10046 SS5]|uniref:amidase n=1 Tax=Auricularia subglabra (strain TFB-10046 / SS5) TaxID=717982 RepID=J0D060_AURST|nr:amidase signature enzyme [Auricularia subglabra TFB-10046 SS5]